VGKAPGGFEATYIGSKVCLGCHAASAATYATTLMGRLQRTGKSLECETCHGPGSAHAKAGGGRGVGGIISYRANDLSRTAEENNAICLGCHEHGERVYWEGSVHQVRGLACTNCHTIMTSVSAQHQLKTAFEPDTCFQCHKDRRAQMLRSSHMPMREGKVTCTNCHNPHGSTTEAMLRQDSINDNCYTCHAEKRGPFLFEHAPVRENCLNCHDPHGSINEFSLKMSRPRLCFECHTIGHGETTGPNNNFTMGRSCQNCHTMIHGSNSPAGGALQR
jgi:DmsE family decaheme c-type cytochrome